MLSRRGSIPGASLIRRGTSAHSTAAGDCTLGRRTSLGTSQRKYLCVRHHINISCSQPHTLNASKPCSKARTNRRKLTQSHSRHSPIPTPRRCPFCKVNAARLSFNRIDNFKEHILRHSRDRDNCRARTEFHPDAEEYYRRLSDTTKGERRQAKGRGRGMLSPRSEASDDSGGAEERC